MNKNMTLTATLAALALLTGVVNGCDADEVDSVGPAPPIEGATPPPPARDSVRLKVDQLQNSLPTIAGNDADGAPISWLYENGEQRIGLFGVLGSTLGDPDYISVTDEPGVPNAMYLKFGSDIALNVCRQMAEADAATGSGQRTLTRFAPIDGSAADADIEANIRYLHLRFLGIRVAQDDSETIADLRAIFDAGMADATTPSPPLEGWNAVCVALMTSPAFHIY